ncbi:MAG: LytTR family DNA-binding domain-containing protein [Pseudoflavonifractor sp.]
MNIAIVEDEVSDREHLLDCLAIYADDNKAPLTISTFETADAFLADGTITRYDLIFLDIYMGETTGMELAQRLRAEHVRSQLVFTTTSSAHAVTSYEVGATYYLLKPYDFDQFLRMMQAVMARTEKDEPSVGVKVGRSVEQIPLSSILFVDYSDHFVQVHTPTRIIRSGVAFKDAEERVANYPQFLTCYRNVMINMDKVEKLEGDHFLLQHGHSIPITRGCVREMREAYSAYIFSRMKRGVLP